MTIDNLCDHSTYLTLDWHHAMVGHGLLLVVVCGLQLQLVCRLVPVETEVVLMEEGYSAD